MRTFILLGAPTLLFYSMCDSFGKSLLCSVLVYFLYRIFSGTPRRDSFASQAERLADRDRRC